MNIIKYYNYLVDDWSLYEIILNILFIILLIIISILIYWDIINRKILKNSRCLKFNDLLNEGIFKIIVKYKQDELFEIEYDFIKKETRLGKILPPKGSVENQINIQNFPFWSFTDERVEYKPIEAKEKLDKLYFVDDIDGDFVSSKFTYIGEPKLINFIKDPETETSTETNFFKEINTELTE